MYFHIHKRCFSSIFLVIFVTSVDVWRRGGYLFPSIWIPITKTFFLNLNALNNTEIRTFLLWVTFDISRHDIIQNMLMSTWQEYSLYCRLVYKLLSNLQKSKYNGLCFLISIWTYQDGRLISSNEQAGHSIPEFSWKLWNVKRW